MKTILFLVLISFFPFCSSGQDNPHAISVNVSNNGIIGADIIKFYFNPIQEYAPGDEVDTYKQSSLKINATYSYRTKKKFEYSITGGFGLRNDNYHVAGTFIDGNKRQNYFTLSPAISKYWEFGDFIASTGLGLYFERLSNYAERYEVNDPSQIIHSTVTTDGGNVIGLVSTSSVKWNLTEHFFLNVQGSFGMFGANIGGNTTQSVVFQDPVVLPVEPAVIVNEYKNNFMSSPELTFGIGVSF